MNCKEIFVPETVARIKCAAGHTPFQSVSHTELRCQTNGEWDFTPLGCVPKCGSLLPETQTLLYNAEDVHIAKVPWHVVIYEYRSERFKYICGGSIISRRLVISAAHCFWNPNGYFNHESLYQVGVGKNHREYDAPEENQVYFFNITKLVNPVSYQDYEGNYNLDFTVIILADPIYFQNRIRPVCINRNLDGDARLIRAGLQGLIAGWGLTESGLTSTLRMAQFDTMDAEQCRTKVDESIRLFITADKFCVGDTSREVMPCQGDSGGGFVRERNISGVAVYYLLGVVSSGGLNIKQPGMCNTKEAARLTNVHFYDHLIAEAENLLSRFMLPEYWRKNGETFRS